jgi:hypothetical protein
MLVKFTVCDASGFYTLRPWPTWLENPPSIDDLPSYKHPFRTDCPIFCSTCSYVFPTFSYESRQKIDPSDSQAPRIVPTVELQDQHGIQNQRHLIQWDDTENTKR